MIQAGTFNPHHQWQHKNTHYLFNRRARSKMFRANFLAALSARGFTVNQPLPKKWIAHCKKIGHGEPAMIYLARYLYRGVVNDKKLLYLDGDRLTCQY
ncbi:MAG: hypothetical protein ACJAUP_003466 [Cellvibrionaceae bacterium]